MKKVLLTTSAIALMAGAASAGVSLSGAARFGLQYDSAATSPTPKTKLEKRFSVYVTGSTQTDGGMSLGAKVLIRNNERSDFIAGPLPHTAIATTTVNSARVWASQGGFSVSAGNIAGSIDSMPGLYAGSVGLNGNGYHNVVTNSVAGGTWNWIGYDWGGGKTGSGAGNNGIEVSYSMGNLGIDVSRVAVNDATTAANTTDAVISYKFGGWTAALGSQTGVAATNKTVFTLGGKLGGATVGIAYANNAGTVKTVLSGSFQTSSAVTVSGFIANDSSAGAKNPMGVSVAYSLGGGATAVGGVTATPTGSTVASAGMKFSF